MLKRLSTISIALLAMGLSSQIIAHGYHQKQAKKVYQHAPKVKQFAIKQGHKEANHWRRGNGHHRHRPNHYYNQGHNHGHTHGHGHYHNDHGHQYYVGRDHRYCPTNRYSYSPRYGTYFIVGTVGYGANVYVHKRPHYKHWKSKRRPSGKLQVTLGF